MGSTRVAMIWGFNNFTSLYIHVSLVYKKQKINVEDQDLLFNFMWRLSNCLLSLDLVRQSIVHYKKTPKYRQKDSEVLDSYWSKADDNPSVDVISFVIRVTDVPSIGNKGYLRTYEQNIFPLSLKFLLFITSKTSNYST